MRNKKSQTKSIMVELREIRDKISLETQDMTYEQLREYLDKEKSLFPNAPWGKKGKGKK